jgi:glucose-1-phosphate thymidylyltransferase
VHHGVEAVVAAGARYLGVTSSAALASEVRVCLEPWQRLEGLQIHHLEQEPPIGLTGAVTLAAPLIGSDPCIVHPGNVLLDAPLSPFLSQIQPQGAGVALLVEPPARAVEGDIGVGGCEARDGSAAIGLFGPDAVRRMGAQHAVRQSCGSLAQAVDAAGLPVELMPVPAWREYAGDPLDLLELNRVALERLNPDRLRPVSDGSRIEGRVQIHPTATLRSSVIVGPTVIGRGASIANAYIGPYTSIGPGVQIEGAEIERSIIGADASIMHIGRRLFSSVVGRSARVHHDMSLPRAFRLMVGDRTEVALC